MDVDDATYLRGRALMVPVLGVTAASLHDSFKDRRGSFRVHHALDILAPRGTPVLAADDGRVLRMRQNALGGITIYAVDAGERFVYYYAHLDHYAATLREGKIVSKGEVIGYVGTTGNAPRNTPHLHLQLMKRPATARWWDGTPIDPLPYLMLPGVKQPAP
jgi:murein DD-endopeptidase MepM/ murein hydrolase activator NlpD